MKSLTLSYQALYPAPVPITIGTNQHNFKTKSSQKMRAFNVPSAGIEPAQFPIGV